MLCVTSRYHGATIDCGDDDYVVGIPQGSGAHTKPSSYTTLISSLPYDVSGIAICPVGTTWWNAALANVLFDVAIGGASSEVDIATNVLFHHGNIYQYYGFFFQFLIPIPLPAGTRISMRCQSSDSDNTLPFYMKANLIPSCDVPNTPHAAAIHTIGVTEASTSGVTVDPGGTTDTWGSWEEISSSSPCDARGVVIGHGEPGRDHTEYFKYKAVQVGIGSAGNEQEICGYTFADGSATDCQTPYASPPFPVAIKAGERISARAKSDITSSPTREIQVALYLWE